MSRGIKYDLMPKNLGQINTEIFWDVLCSSKKISASSDIQDTLLENYCWYAEYKYNNVMNLLLCNFEIMTDNRVVVHRKY